MPFIWNRIISCPSPSPSPSEADGSSSLGRRVCLCALAFVWHQSADRFPINLDYEFGKWQMAQNVLSAIPSPTFFKNICNTQKPTHALNAALVALLIGLLFIGANRTCVPPTACRSSFWKGSTISVSACKGPKDPDRAA